MKTRIRWWVCLFPAVLLSVAVGQIIPHKTEDRATWMQQAPEPSESMDRTEATVLEKPIDPTEYIVGPGDVFMISITGGEPYLELVTVSPTGLLIIPGIGSFHAGALTAELVCGQAVDRISAAFPTYDVVCALYDIREFRVAISGAVLSPGFYDVSPVSRISDLIILAGDRLTNAAMHRVQVENDAGERVTYDMTQFYYAGDLSLNPQLREGDRIVVPFIVDERDRVSSVQGLQPVVVIGEVNTPGVFIFQPGLKAKDYIALAGGPTTGGSRRGVELVRSNGDIVKDPESDIEAGDIIYVKRSLRTDMVGTAGMVQAFQAILSLYLSFLAATR